MVRILNGSLFQYMSSPALVAFESAVPSPAPPSPNKLILVGGLSDGLLPLPYVEKLETACLSLGWSLVQPIISSSYLGFGYGSLSRDTKELGELMNFLKVHRDAENFAIVGHSTGCQNAVHFMKHGNHALARMVKCIVLQGPVSDRESAMLNDNYPEDHKKYIEHARRLKCMGQEREMMPRDAMWAPITASRFLSLYDLDGEDDFFSSDLSDEDLAQRLEHIGLCGNSGLHTLVAFSGSDEYVPPHVDKRALLERLCDAMNSRCVAGRKVAVPLYIETGNHNLSEGEDDADTFIQKVSTHLQLAVS